MDELNKYIDEMRREWVELLNSNTHFKFSSGNSENLDVSIRTNTDDNLVIEVSYPRYLDYQDKGIAGSKIDRTNGSPFAYSSKKPPIEPLRLWLSQNNITDISPYAIQKTLFEKGIEPRNLGIDTFLMEWSNILANEKADIEANKIIQPLNNIE